ncbi:biosynthetic arginine decarboxylase [Lusitaniella coriacea LEGE 07157]|uniref:Biosynthetic arginine decarboxylase n=1 Tax=Lusitaniella coriacea LEGE 07157 TaxID=945747 RepID=A0A8J7J1K7_9CYAN|nr:biosynthetic arginine decarboxylase [Lusitaniella coriacea]MBE9115849.1 biosynthetic arginine decarboxylase [Lusitaniella coriacea LEGE 07157]
MGSKTRSTNRHKSKPLPLSSLEDSRETPWTIEDSEKLYRIQGWGEPYFSINAAGRVMVSPQGDRGGSLDLYELVESLRQRNLGLPLLIRFPDILADRVERLNACFSRAIARYNYPNTYRGVYPVKCNQSRHLVEALVEFGKPYHFGLEVGSKPELAIALATLEPSSPHATAPLLMCNGYKDREYIETALLATKLGHFPIIAIEQLEELHLILEIAKKLEIPPVLGVRAKLSAKGSGHWGDSTGDRAKFGLTIPQILAVTTHLQREGMLDSLQLLHFHIGSQISSISTIKDAIREAAQIYGELVNLGAKMQYLDVGGGLAVDYDGSKTNFYASKNYNMQNYANDIVAEVKEACEEREIDAPILVSESGRAIAAHQSVLIFDILGTSDVSPELPPTVEGKEHLILRNLWETYQTLTPENYQETYHDAIQFKEEAISLFSFGYLSLQERARAEQLYWACCQKILDITRTQDNVPDDLEDLEKNMASIYYANLSVFQSAPDAWAIAQLFPIMPVHRLNEEPTQRATLADLTCDSDGKIDRFIDSRNAKEILELHSLPKSEPYYLGMFLVGAYQETMGNLHNLFGDTNVVHIRATPTGYQIDRVVKGDAIADVLSYAQYDPEDLIENIRRLTENALQDRRLTLEDAQRLLQNYEKTLDRYTYLS